MGPRSKKTALFLPLLLILTATTTTVSGQSSSSSCAFSFSQNRQFATCVALPQLSCYLHWTYNASTGIADIAFRATGPTTGNWVAWALNPTGSADKSMPGAQALVAYQHTNGSTWAYTSSVKNTEITTLVESDLSFAVADLSAETSDSQIIIFAKVQIPNNATSMRHVWQVGPLNDGSPMQHPSGDGHLLSKGTVDFLSGIAQGGGGDSRLKRKNIHGVLNAVSWGTMMPLGFMIARYMRVFKSADPAWFYLHILCQSSAYIIGVAGWGLGLKLGSESVGITHHAHRYIGIFLFCLATLQVFAILLRLNKDHKYRFYWNIYHHGVGYAVIILSIINVFKGLNILSPDEKWKTIYIVVLIVLAAIAVFLEGFTWIVVLRRKKNGEPEQKYPYAQNAYGAPNGQAGRPQPSV